MSDQQIRAAGGEHLLHLTGAQPDEGQGAPKGSKMEAYHRNRLITMLAAAAIIIVLVTLDSIYKVTPLATALGGLYPLPAIGLWLVIVGISCAIFRAPSKKPEEKKEKSLEELQAEERKNTKQFQKMQAQHFKEMRRLEKEFNQLRKKSG